MRLINADTLLDEIQHLQIFLGGESLFTPAIKETILRTIDEQPTVDAVPVERCGECKFSEDNGDFYCCHHLHAFVPKEFGCIQGKRKDGQE